MIKRVKRQMLDFNSDYPLENIHLLKTQSLDLATPIIQLIGPQHTPYEGGKFNIEVIFPEAYPFKPLKLKFLTKIYHPSIHPTGTIHCCVIPQINYEWSPAFTLQRALVKLLQILRTPESCLECGNQQVISKFKQNQQNFYKIAKEWTEQYTQQQQ